jgi:hypothetical protein
MVTVTLLTTSYVSFFLLVSNQSVQQLITDTGVLPAKESLCLVP